MIDRVMTSEEQESFDRDARRHAWLKEATMTDAELRARLDKYFYDGYTDKILSSGWRFHYDKVYSAKLKYFLSTGNYMFYDEGYIDGQSEYVISEIMKRDGADTETIDEVLNGKATYKFKS